VPYILFALISLPFMLNISPVTAPLASISKVTVRFYEPVFFSG